VTVLGGPVLESLNCKNCEICTSRLFLRRCAARGGRGTGLRRFPASGKQKKTRKGSKGRENHQLLLPPAYTSYLSTRINCNAYAKT